MLQKIERSDVFTITDAAALIGRSGESGLGEWGTARQRLPALA